MIFCSAGNFPANAALDKAFVQAVAFATNPSGLDAFC